MTADYLSNNRASRKSFSASSPRDDHAEDHTIAAPIAPDDLAAGVSPIALRDYQRLAVDYIHVGLGEDPIYVALPTGTGKAVAAAAVASNVLSRGRVLVIAHRKELIGQLAGHMRQWCGSGQVGVVMAERDECGKPVIVGSIQTLSEKSRLDRVLEASEEPFALVIIDECHHAALDNSYGALVDRLSPGVPVLGFSATPRTRVTSKFDPLFKACVFERTIGQMSEAGWLAPLRQQRVVIPLDLTGAPTGQNAESGELDYASEWLSVVAREPEVLDALVRGTIEHIGERTTLAFCVDVAHAIELAEAYDAAGVPAAAIWGAMPARDRAATLAAWRAGEIKVVTNFSVLTEGFDYPEIACLVMARPTRSHTLYLQMLGRGTRTSPGKDHCAILDTTGLAPDHRQIQLSNIVPLDEDGAPPPDGKGEHVLTMLDPRSAGKWKWNVVRKVSDNETDVLTATVDHKRHLFVAGDVKSGLWRIYLEEPNDYFMPLSDDKWPQQEAIARAAEWLRDNSVLPLSKNKARWQDQPPSGPQIKLLKNLYSLDELLAFRDKGIRLTRGFASSLIDRKMIARKAHKLRRQLRPELVEQSPADKALQQQFPWLYRRMMEEQQRQGGAS